jgi:hypothetical protein
MKTSCCILDTTLLQLNTHEIISDPVAFKWLCRELRNLSQYLVDTTLSSLSFSASRRAVLLSASAMLRNKDDAYHVLYLLQG